MYVIVLVIIAIYYYYLLQNPKNSVAVTKKQMYCYSSTLLLLVLVAYICSLYDINMYIELKQDLTVTRFHCIVKYAMISWFLLYTLVSIYFYLTDSINIYILFVLAIYITLTLFIIYLVICQYYLINYLIIVEIDRINYLASKAADAAAKQAQLEQDELERTKYIVIAVLVYFTFGFFCMAAVYVLDY